MNAQTSQFHSHSFVPSQPLSALPHVQKALSDLAVAHKGAQMKQVRNSRPTLAENAHKLLSLASAQPFVPVARLFAQIGHLSQAAQAAAREGLEEAKLAAFEEIRIGRRNSLLIEVTDKGWEFLGGDSSEAYGPRWDRAPSHSRVAVHGGGRRRGHQAQGEWRIRDTTHDVDGRLDHKDPGAGV